MIEKPLETFAPPALVELVNNASFWVNVSLYGLLSIASAMAIFAWLRPEEAKRLVTAAVVVVFVGFISDVFVYRLYWGDLCAAAGYYKGEIHHPEVPRLTGYYFEGPGLEAEVWEGSLNVQLNKVKTTPYSEVRLAYYGGRWGLYLAPLIGLEKVAVAMCPTYKY